MRRPPGAANPSGVKILVAGAAGMLGRDVLDAAGDDAVGLAHADLDATDSASVGRIVGEVRPDLVVNCAAWTDVDGAEEHEADALRVNGDGAGTLAAAAADAGAAVLYVSSDYVFDGTKGEPYVESDPTNPISAYGRTKLAGERATADANPRHYIVRTSWLFGVGGKNFVETMLRVGRERGEARVVDDQIGCPTYTGHLAQSLLSLARDGEFGIHHRAAQGQCSWFEFARMIFQKAHVDCRVEPCSTAEFPRPARRPAYSVLESERTTTAFGADGLIPTLPPWQHGLAAYLAEREVAV
jgi:dTDP-4-dehydrorhamnose reductase